MKIFFLLQFQILKIVCFLFVFIESENRFSYRPIAPQLTLVECKHLESIGRQDSLFNSCWCFSPTATSNVQQTSSTVSSPSSFFK